MKALWITLALVMMPLSVWAWDDLYANDGSYMGNTNPNQFDANSVNNPYGQYGNPYSQQSTHNPYGQYGSTYSPSSPNNPYAAPATAVPQYGGPTRQYGGWKR